LRGLSGWKRVHKCKKPPFPQQAVLENSIFFFLCQEKKEVLIKPIYFNIITLIPQLKMYSFCQNPAHYTGFSFLSEGLTLESFCERGE